MGGPGRAAAELNGERAAVREDPAAYYQRMQAALVVVVLTEHRNPPRTLAAAWRIATGEYDVDTDTAARRAHEAKTWLKRAFSPSLAAHLMAAQLGPAQFVDAITDQVTAVKRTADGSIRRGKDGQPIPDLEARRRAMPLWRDALAVAGLLQPHRAPDVEQLEALAAAQLAELEDRTA